MKIYKVIPLDRKGEQDGNEWLTQYMDEASKAYLEGHSVSVGEVVAWQTVSVKLVEAE